VTCPIFEVGYGGARGGGKTDGSLGEWIIHEARYGKHARGLFIRRKLVDLEDTIARAKDLFRPLGARWREQKSEFAFPSGATVRFRYLERDEDAQNYQGHSYTRVYVEEMAQFASPDPINKLKATLRSPHGVPCGFRATFNPGGPGHGWVKARYVDPGPWTIVRETFKNPFTNQDIVESRIFIPAKLSDNPQLLVNDPMYVARLQQAGSKALVRAWLLGDWDIIEGAFFDRWSATRNVARHFAPPQHWLRFGSFDWGSAKPYSYGLWAVASEDAPFVSQTGEPMILPRGGLYRYRENYGMQPGKPNEGLKLSAEQVAHAILLVEAGEKIDYRVGDPAIFAENGGPSIGERMAREKVLFRPADNKRVASKGAVGGWDQMRDRIDGEADERPMLVSSELCKDFNRTLPSLQHDTHRAEDVDSDGEDHAPDEGRYACMSRPWVKPLPGRPAPRDRWRPERQDESWRTV